MTSQLQARWTATVDAMQELRLTHEHELLKQQEVLGGTFDSKNYISERIWANSRDGKVKIPISLVYHKDTPKSAETPLLLYGYGSYG